MLRLPKKMLFALEAVVDIAYNGRAAPVQSKEITRRQGIPQRYLEQVMQQLVRAGILKGVRGPRGGYHLARERRRISVGEIIRVINELDQANSNLAYDSSSDLGNKVVKPMLEELNDDVMLKLDDITLQDLCQRASAYGVTSESEKHLDFTI
ncbi:MAG: transcriptional regulator [Kordiimonas sp.]|nr:transcriptional regulator [Kordiimonas sp.]|tara:strand:+ start:1349 stop:1804 length:456 start_codon:yes stop_codon:yes gene_type:complete